MSNERRQFARIPFQGVAMLQLSSASAPLSVSVADLSFKGALVDIPDGADVTLGDTGGLTLQLGPPDDCITMLVDVVHVRNRQAGLQCRGIDLDSVTHLRRLLAINLGDASLLDRDLKALIGGAS